MAARGSGDKSERRREALTSSTGELVRNSAFLPRRVVRVYPPEATSSEKLVIGFAGAGACREMHPPVLEQYLAAFVNCSEVHGDSDFVHTAVAGTAKCNQVLLDILPRQAAKFLVVDFQVRHRSTGLASPSIPPQHALPQLVVLFRVESQARRF